jgi:ADP-heptose:LPS heptosyltransferase
MAPEPAAPAARALPPRTVKQRVGYVARYTLTTLFRTAIRCLRFLRVLPRHATNRAGDTLLIVHLTPHLGDTIMVMPMIEALRVANPNARIEFAVEASAAPLLRATPEIDHIHALALGQQPPVRPLKAIGRALRVTRTWWKHMRTFAPAVCLLPRWDNDQYRSSVLAWLLDAPQRIGFASDTIPGTRRAPYRDAFLTQRIHGGSGMHEAEHFCLLAAESGFIPASSIRQAGASPVRALQRIAATQDWPALAHRLGIDPSRPFAVVAPGASMPRKVWSTQRWARVCEALFAKGFDVVLLGGASDKTYAEALDELCKHRTILAAGKTTLLESTTLLSHASLFVGGDSGPGHVAGALGVPSVILFAAVEDGDPDDVLSPHRIRPLGPFVAAVCPPRNLPPCRVGCTAAEPHCLTLIEPAPVLDAIDAVLKYSAAMAHTAPDTPLLTATLGGPRQ